MHYVMNFKIIAHFKGNFIAIVSLKYAFNAILHRFFCIVHFMVPHSSTTFFQFQLQLPYYTISCPNILLTSMFCNYKFSLSESKIQATSLKIFVLFQNASIIRVSPHCAMFDYITQLQNSRKCHVIMMNQVGSRKLFSKRGQM